MGTLAVDIETASPFQEPGPGNRSTDFYECIAVALGYREDERTAPEETVIFRRGGWDLEYTADLFDQLTAWCDERDIERTLTYNGAYFDLKHLGNWAKKIDSEGIRTNTYADLQSVFPMHIDLAPASTDRHENELFDDQVILPLWKTCKLEGVNDESVWYDDYDFNEDYISSLGIGDKFVKAQHVGQALGEQFVDGIVAGLEETITHRELRRLLYDYAVGDVEVLFGLYDSLGGEELDSKYDYPLAEVER